MPVEAVEQDHHGVLRARRSGAGRFGHGAVVLASRRASARRKQMNLTRQGAALSGRPTMGRTDGRAGRTFEWKRERRGANGADRRSLRAYVLLVLVIVYVLNFIDRQILSILAEDIKADLGVTDAQIGFLYGTAFAVFYAVFGIPLGRLAGRLGAALADRVRPAVLVGDDALRPERRAASAARGVLSLRRRHGRGERVAGGVLHAVRLFSAGACARRSSRSTRAASTSARASGCSSAGSSSTAGTRPTRPPMHPSACVAGRRRSWPWGCPGSCSRSGSSRCESRFAGRARGSSPRRTRRPSTRGAAGTTRRATAADAHRRAARPAPRPVRRSNCRWRLLVAGLAAGLTALVGDAAQWIALGIGVHAAFSWAQVLAWRERRPLT